MNSIAVNTTAADDEDYTFTASLTLTLPPTPIEGQEVTISNMSGTLTCIVARNGLNIAGLAEDLTIDVLNIGLTLKYSGATKGWTLT